MPEVNKYIVKAIVNGIRNAAIITDDILRLILEQISVYIQKNYNLNLKFDSLDDLEGKLVQIADQYPADDAMVYGIGKAESMNIGATGVISRRVGKGAPKALVEAFGLTPQLSGSLELYDVLSKYKVLLVRIGQIKDEDIILTKLDDEQVDAKLGGYCPYIKACQSLNKEGVFDIFGNVACVRTLIFAGIAEAIIKKSFDTKVEEYNPPNCKVKIFEL
nr:hypothetical protein [Candidatus Freyarchaeota archaeon]